MEPKLELPNEHLENQEKTSMILDNSDNEGIKSTKVLENLIDAFGGHTQLPPQVIGMALVSQIYNGKINTDDCVAEFDRLSTQVHEKFAGKDVDISHVRETILDGMETIVNKSSVNFHALEAVRLIGKKYELS